MSKFRIHVTGVVDLKSSLSVPVFGDCPDVLTFGQLMLTPDLSTTKYRKYSVDEPETEH